MRLYGEEFNSIYRGVVEINEDPKNLGRCKIRVPAIHGPLTFSADLLPWARPVTTAPISRNKGSISIPNVHDVVWVMFEGANKQYPVYLGGTYSSDNLVISNNKNVVYTEEGNTIYYDNDTKSYHINAGSNSIILNKDSISLFGNVRIKGNIEVEGSMNLSGNVEENQNIIIPDDTYSYSPGVDYGFISGALGGIASDLLLSSGSWIKGNNYLTKASMENNVQIIYYFLKDRGWSKNAIAGLLGNMQQESTINPGLWQSLKEGNMNLGFGLVQWTPASKYINWANSNGYAIDDGNYQLKWIDEKSTEDQYYKTNKFPISFDEFKKSTQSVEYLVEAFMRNFERPSEKHAMLDKRFEYGNYWYKYISQLPETRTSGKGKELIEYASQFIGGKYVYGGESLTNGIDCSAFVQQMYAHFGYNLPRTSAEQRNVGKAVQESDIQLADIVCYDGHVGLYAGDGKLLHASNSKPYPDGGIKISNNYKYKTVLSIRRIFSD